MPSRVKWSPSGTTSPMFDAVMVGREAVLHTPQDSLGSAADSNLAVNRPDAGLHSIRTEICKPRDVGIALALGDEGQDFRLSIAEALASPGPIEGAMDSPTEVAAWPRRSRRRSVVVTRPRHRDDGLGRESVIPSSLNRAW